MTDKKLYEKIYKEAEQFDVPEHLHPKAIEEKLSQKRARKKNRMKMVATIAACLILCLAGINIYQSKGINDYEALYKLIPKETMKTSKGGEMAVEDGAMEIEDAGDVNTDSAPKDDSGSTDSGAKEYSGTNVQVEGIDEGDVVKTDGKYIYALDVDYSVIKIVKMRGKVLEEVGKINLEAESGGKSFYELYVSGNTLLAIGGQMDHWSSGGTCVLTFDISDKEKPKKQGDVVQSGSYKSSRLSGDYLYTFTTFMADTSKGRWHKSSYVPSVEEELIPMKDICIPENPSGKQYLVMTAIDLKHPDRVVGRKAIYGSTSTFYVSQSNIYMAGGQEYGNRTTEICKVPYKEGRFLKPIKGKVKGSLKNSFSMDEYKGNLRLVTTLQLGARGEYNNVYVLDENLKELGSILKLAKDEKIYSARFMGDMGYFVTYRETDPLFSVDLSNPRDPKIIGELKIPGFSEYLHFYGKNQLLGIGKTDGRDIKISMFDISDPANVKEKSTHEIREAYYAEALGNHKAVMIDVDKNLFGFSTRGTDGTNYRLYSYVDGKFKKRKKVDIGPSETDVRGLYRGNYFYLVETDQIRIFDLNDFKYQGELGI